MVPVTFNFSDNLPFLRVTTNFFYFLQSSLLSTSFFPHPLFFWQHSLLSKTFPSFRQPFLLSTTLSSFDNFPFSTTFSSFDNIPFVQDLPSSDNLHYFQKSSLFQTTFPVSVPDKHFSSTDGLTFHQPLLSNSPGFRSRNWSRSRPEPGYLAGAGAVTLARLRLHLKYLFNNSRKLHRTWPNLMASGQKGGFRAASARQQWFQHQPIFKPLLFPPIFLLYYPMSELWIHSNFFRIRIQLLSSMRIRVQLLYLCGSGSSLKKFVKNNLLKSFLLMKKTTKIAQLW